MGQVHAAPPHPTVRLAGDWPARPCQLLSRELQPELKTAPGSRSIPPATSDDAHPRGRTRQSGNSFYRRELRPVSRRRRGRGTVRFVTPDSVDAQDQRAWHPSRDRARSSVLAARVRSHHAAATPDDAITEGWLRRLASVSPQRASASVLAAVLFPCASQMITESLHFGRSLLDGADARSSSEHFLGGGLRRSRLMNNIHSQPVARPCVQADPDTSLIEPFEIIFPVLRRRSTRGSTTAGRAAGS